jgi:hypothetical protein
MNRNKHLVSILLLIAITASLSAVDIPAVDTFFSESEKETVKSGQIITRMYLKNNAKNENTHLSIDLPPMEQWFSESMRKSEMISDEKAFFPMDNSPESRLRLYNTLIAYSRLTGMTYWSRRIQQEQQLLLNTFRIDKASGKSAIADAVVSEIPDYRSDFFLQEDNKFGELPYLSELYTVGNDIAMVNTSLQGIFLVTGKKENVFVTFFFFSEEDGGYYYYTVNTMRIKLDPVVNRLHPTTFSNRLRAATVHLAGLLGLDWKDRLNPWDEEKMVNGDYRTY